MSENAIANAETRLANAKNEIILAYDEACRQAENDKQIPSPQARKILSILLLRQKDALNLLDNVKSVVDGKITPVSAARKITLRSVVSSRFVNHPVFRTVLYLLLTVFCAMSIFIKPARLLPLPIAVLLFFAEAVKLFGTLSEGNAETEYISHVSIDNASKDSFARHMSAGLVRDMQDILNLFSIQTIDTTKKTETDMAEMYQTIYDAAACNEELLKPVLDRQEQLLWSIGLETVDFCEETAFCFDIEDADCPSQMIHPAIRRRKDHSIVLKGSYIRQK